MSWLDNNLLQPGPQGSAGATGATGPTGSPGEQGPQGPAGSSAIASVQSFIQPAVGATVSINSVEVTGFNWVPVGAIIYIATGGYYEVTDTFSTQNIEVRNLYTTDFGNASPGATITNGSLSYAAGARGATGATGPSGPGGVAVLADSVTCTGPTTGGSSEVTLVYSPPVGKVVLMTGVLLVLRTPMTGTGSTQIKSGASAFDANWILSQNTTDADSPGLTFGLDVAELGANFDPTFNYRSSPNNNSNVRVIMDVTGTVDTAAVFRAYVIGYELTSPLA